MDALGPTRAPTNKVSTGTSMCSAVCCLNDCLQSERMRTFSHGHNSMCCSVSAKISTQRAVRLLSDPCTCSKLQCRARHPQKGAWWQHPATGCIASRTLRVITTIKTYATRMQEESLRLKKPFKFFSDEFRSAIYVGDLVRVVEYFLTEAPEAAHGQTYNAGGPERLSRADMAYAIAEHCGIDASAVDVAESAAVTRTVPSPFDISMDSSKLTALLPFELQRFSAALRHVFPSNQ